MSTIIKIKRTTGVQAPSTIIPGELYYIHDDLDQDSGVNGLGKRLFLGNEAGTAGIEIGGSYTVDLLSHTPGTLTAGAALIADSSSKLDDLKVDNLELNGNTVSSTDANGNIVITPNGTGQTIITNLQIYEGGVNTDIVEYIQDTIDSTLTDGDGITFTYDDAAGTVTVGITDAGIAIAKLAQSSITIGTDAVTLGNTITDINGLTSLDVDNLTLDGNTISSADVNGDIVLDPNGIGNINVSSAKITNLADPTDAQDAVTKAYVDAVKTGLDVKSSVTIATDDALAATYSNNVLTATSVGSINSATGVTGQLDAAGSAIALTVGDRVLVKNQTNAVHNGLYQVTTVGDGSTAYVLTRSEDADNTPNNEVSGGMFTFVEDGTYRDSGWVLSSPDGDAVLGTDELTFSQFSGAGQITAGAGLSKDGNTLDVNVAANGGLEIVSDDLQVKASGITNAMLAGNIDLTSKVTGTLPVGNGGTGIATATANGILYGNGADAFNVTAAGTGGYFLYSNAGTPDWTNVIDGGTYP